MRSTLVDGVCPTIDVDGAPASLAPRPVTFSDFPDICEASFADNPHRIDLAGAMLHGAPSHPKKIVLLGDTGCRIKEKNGKISIQDCNDPQAWPFAAIAKAAAEWQPDLVVHVGDYHYREAACPEGDRRCSGAAGGDNWEAWRQDFFAPAKPLLLAAPWIFARGNHELCGTGGNGWFHLLESRAVGECVDRTDPYLISFENFGLGVIDSAEAENIAPSLAKLKKDPSAPFWILLHRPFQAKGADDESKLRVALPAALKLAGQVAGVMAGHRHLFRLTEFADGRPPEFIFGNGGDKLESKGLRSQPGEKSDGLIRFGFSTIEETGMGKWLLTVRDVAGQPVLAWQIETKLGTATRISRQIRTNN